jgi:predicted DNA-binding transcriptional regulator
MQSHWIVSFLVNDHQREMRSEAERAWQIKEAAVAGRVTQLSLRGWLGRQLISWGTRLQAGALPIPEVRQKPCTNE